MSVAAEVRPSDVQSTTRDPGLQEHFKPFAALKGKDLHALSLARFAQAFTWERAKNFGEDNRGHSR